MTMSSPPTQAERPVRILQSAVVALALMLGACASTAPPPGWQSNARSSLEQYTQAYLSGNQALSQEAWRQARLEVAQSGRPDLMARLELTLCALEVASLITTDCPGYAALDIDAGVSEKAYAAFLKGQWQGLDVQSLPPQYRDFFKSAAKTATPTAGNDREAVPSHLQNISNPLSVLVGAGILSRRGLLRSQDIDMATDAASSQGWRRPLLAWLGLQLQAAKVRGDNREAAAIERRISLVTQQP